MDLILILKILVSALATEATVKVLLSGKIFDRPRGFLYSKIPEESFLGGLIRCPYCLSFWFSAIILVGMVFFPKTWLVYSVWICVQRLSNVIDDIIDKIYYGQYGSSGLSFGDKDKEG